MLPRPTEKYQLSIYDKSLQTVVQDWQAPYTKPSGFDKKTKYADVAVDIKMWKLINGGVECGTWLID